MTDPANSEKQNLHIPFIKYNCVRRLNQSDDKWEWYVSSANIIQSSVGNYLLISLINTSKSNFSVVRKQLYYVTCTWTILINNNLFLKIHSVNHPPNIVLNVQLYITSDVDCSFSYLFFWIKQYIIQIKIGPQWIYLWIIIIKFYCTCSSFGFNWLVRSLTIRTASSSKGFQSTFEGKCIKTLAL